MPDTQIRLPAGSWDSHVHVIDENYWKIKPDASFHPKRASLDQLLAFEESIGIGHVCIIASSVYGTDNGCSIDALRRLAGRGRGVACINPETITDAELDELHAVGFRGVRINLRTRSQSLSGADAWEKLLLQYAERLRRLGWAIQIFVSMDQIADIRPVISKLGLCSGDDRNGLKVVFDHLGHPEAGKVDQQTGCSDLYEILQENRNGAFVKLSGTFRLTEAHNLETHIKTLLEIAPDQVVWGSDWPHTAGPEHNPRGDPMAVQDFLTPNMPQFIQDCVGWCSGDPAMMKKIWVDNPRRLWDYSGDD